MSCQWLINNPYLSAKVLTLFCTTAKWWIRDFPGGTPTNEGDAIILPNFAKMKEFGPEEGGASPLDPPLLQYPKVSYSKHHTCIVFLHLFGVLTMMCSFIRTEEK